MPVRPLILSPAILVCTLRSDRGHLLVHAGGKRRLALRTLFSMTPWVTFRDGQTN